MATVGEIVQLACEATGDLSSEAQDWARRALRIKYESLYDSHNWREAQRVVEGITIDPALNGRVFLPFDAAEVVFLSLSYDGGFSYSRLSMRERDWIERRVGTTFATPGTLPLFYRAENLAWPGLNPGKFTFTTSDKSSFSVYIEGRDAANNPVNESFILQGIVNPDQTVIPSSVTTKYSYSLVTTLSKGVGSAPLIVDPEIGNAISMPAALTELLFTQIVLYPAPLFTLPDGSPNPGLFIRVGLKLKPDNLDSDMSVPRISHLVDALQCFVLSSLYTRLGNVTKHQAFDQEGMGHVQAAVNVEKNQAEWRQQAYPTVYESGNYLDSAGDTYSSATPFG